MSAFIFVSSADTGGSPILVPEAIADCQGTTGDCEPNEVAT